MSGGCSPTAAAAPEPACAEEPARIEICEHAAAQLDPAGIRAALAELDYHASVTVVAGLCSFPERVGRGGAVAGLCTLPGSPAEYRARAGYEREPAALSLVPLSLASPVPAERLRDAAALLAVGMAGRGRGSARGGPFRLVPAQGPLSRRALFSRRTLVARPVAAIDADACLGSEVCGRCAAACPEHALSHGSGPPQLDPQACLACGACVSACPVEAVSLEGVSLERYERQLELLLARAAAVPRGIVFACSEALPALERELAGAEPQPGWLPLELPSIALVTPGWVLQALTAGAAAVALAACDDRCARSWQERLDYCRVLLAGVAGPAAASRVEVVALSAPLPPIVHVGAREPRPVTLREPAATVQAVDALVSGRGARRAFRVDGSASPLGLARVDGTRCTGCGACAAVCPAGALALVEDEDGVSLRFDARLCDACGACAAACPEQALAVDPVTDLGALARGEAELHRAGVARCRSCGAPLADAEALVARVRELLRPSAAPALLDELGGVCSDCAARLAAGAA